MMQVMNDVVLKLLTRFPMARWSPVPLRLIVGYGFMQHGFAKLSRGPGAFAAILQTMGVPVPHFMAWLTILTELLGGLAVLLGAFVTIVSSADGGCAIGRHVYSTPALSLQERPHRHLVRPVGRDHEDVTGLYPGVRPGEQGLAVTRDRDNQRVASKSRLRQRPSRQR
jgi:DoxX-like protein